MSHLVQISAQVNREGCISINFHSDLLIVIQQLKEKFTIVHRLKGLSSLSSRWTDVDGMNIDLQTKDQWDLIVQVHSKLIR